MLRSWPYSGHPGMGLRLSRNSPKGAGYNVSLVPNVCEAQEILFREHFDVIIAGALPEGGGLGECLHRIGYFCPTPRKGKISIERLRPLPASH